jgi:hypothetical protein
MHHKIEKTQAIKVDKLIKGPGLLKNDMPPWRAPIQITSTTKSFQK